MNLKPEPNSSDRENQSADPVVVESQSASDSRLPARPKSVLPPPNYNSRPIKLKLMALVALLLGTMVLMQKVGDPKFWEQLFPPEVTKIRLDDDLSETKAEGLASDQDSGEETGDGSSDAASKPADKQSPQSRSGDSERAVLENEVLTAKKLGDRITIPDAAAEFWKTSVSKMSTRQQQELFGLLKRIRYRQPIPDDERPALVKIFQVIQSQQKKFHRDMLDRLPILTDGSSEKADLMNRLYESEQFWEQKIQPAFQAGLADDAITEQQEQDLFELQLLLDPVIYRSIQDRSSIGWNGDTAGWLRMWERVIASDWENSAPATHLQLSSQPDFYRGQPVDIAGWIRTIRKRSLQDSQIGVPHYYEMWLRPADSNVAPYCVYVLQLPDGFPAVGTRYEELNQRVELTGLFFKIRSYVDGAKDVRYTPVLLARSFEMTRDPTSMPTESLAWQPSVQIWIGILVAMPLIAAAIAWAVFRSSQTRRFQPGAKTTEKIQHTLHGLVNDPRVQTTEEKIRDLYREETDTPDAESDEGIAKL